MDENADFNTFASQSPSKSNHSSDYYTNDPDMGHSRTVLQPQPLNQLSYIQLTAAPLGSAHFMYSNTTPIPPAELQRSSAKAPGLEATKGPSRIKNTSQKAEKNREAQRSFRERQKNLMAELKIKADRVDEVQAENVKYMRLLDESQKEVERLRSENARLQAQLGLQRLPVKNLFSEF